MPDKKNELGTPIERSADILSPKGFAGMEALPVEGQAEPPTDWNALATSMLMGSMEGGVPDTSNLGGFAQISPEVLARSKGFPSGVLAAISGLSQGLGGDESPVGGGASKEMIDTITKLRKEKRDTLKETTEYRKEFQPQREALTQANKSYSVIKNIIDTDKNTLSMGDIAAVNQFFTLMNPKVNPNVRQTQQVAEAQSIWEKIASAIDYTSETGTFLTPGQQKNLKNAAKVLYGNAVDTFLSEKEEMENVAKRNELDVPTIIGQPKIFKKDYEDYKRGDTSNYIAPNEEDTSQIIRSAEEEALQKRLKELEGGE